MLSLGLTTTGLDPQTDILLIVGIYDTRTDETSEFIPRVNPELRTDITTAMHLVELDAKFRGKEYQQYPYTTDEILERGSDDQILQERLNTSGAVLLHGPWASEFLRKRNFRLPKRVKFLRDAVQSIHPDLVFARWEDLAEVCNINLDKRDLGFPAQRAKLQWQIYRAFQTYREKSRTSQSSTHTRRSSNSRNINQNTY